MSAQDELSSANEQVLDGDERLYEPVEIAHILNIRPDTARQYCRDGRILATKHGTIWHVTRTELKRYLDEGPRKINA